MPTITIITEISNTKEIVFDLARSVDLHLHSTNHTNERVIGGRKSGLLKLNETVIWRAKHFGVYQNLTVKITVFDYPYLFIDEMITGAFHSFKHSHTFQESGKITVMTDIFQYKSPFGILGQLVDFLFLKNYMTSFLLTRNAIIKEFAESDKWKKILNFG